MRTWRIDLGLTPKEIACRLDVNMKSIYVWENNLRKLPKQLRIKIAGSLGYDHDCSGGRRKEGPEDREKANPTSWYRLSTMDVLGGKSCVDSLGVIPDSLWGLHQENEPD